MWPVVEILKTTTMFGLLLIALLAPSDGYITPRSGNIGTCFKSCYWEGGRFAERCAQITTADNGSCVGPLHQHRYGPGNTIAYVKIVHRTATALQHEYYIPPIGTYAVRLTLQLQTNDTIFVDGFESGDTSAWSIVNP